MQLTMTHRPQLAGWFRSSLARSTVVLGGVIVAMAGGLPAQDFDLGIRTDNAAYAPGDTLTATLGLTTRSPGVQAWEYGLKHDTGLLALDTLTFDDTDAEGAMDLGFQSSDISERGGTNVGLVQVVVLSFDGHATIPTEQAFFSLAFVGYTVSVDACPPDATEDVSTPFEFTRELAHTPGAPPTNLLVIAGGEPVDFNLISTNVVIRCEEAPAFRRGDSNANGTVDISDSVLTLNYLFAGGSAPTCQDAVDTNDDGTVDIADPVYSLSFLFLGGPVPVEPFGECGRDPTEDGLDCASFPACR